MSEPLVHLGLLGMHCGSDDPDPAHWTISDRVHVTCEACKKKCAEVACSTVSRRRSSEPRGSGSAIIAA